MIDDPTVIAQLFDKGLSAAAIANLLDLELDDVQELTSGVRPTKTGDADELATAMNKLAWRAFDEGMKILDEGTPALKIRLIQGAMGHTLRLINSQSPKELENLRDELSGLYHSITTDDTDPDSIYADYPDADDAIHYDPSAIETDTATPETNDPDKVAPYRED